MTSLEHQQSLPTEVYLANLREGWANKFGDERLLHDEEYPANPEAVKELLDGIAHICTGQGGEVGHGAYSYTLDETSEHSPVLLWNDAQIVVGFGSGPLDFTTAGIEYMSYEEHMSLLPRESKPLGKYGIKESLLIEPTVGLAMIRRTILPLTMRGNSRGSWVTAEKPANALEIAAAMEIVRLAANPEKADALPKFVEIGYGLDPAAFSGNRKFHNKQYIGLDAALGQYATGRKDTYADAVKSDTAIFQDRVNSEHPGEHIVFTINEGQHLPLEDNSVREVFVSNVLNAPDIELIDKEKMATEVHRVLEKNGRFVIRVNWHQDEWSPQTTIDFLRTNGFTALESIGADDSRYKVLEEEYGQQQIVKAPEGFYIVAQPRTNS